MKHFINVSVKNCSAENNKTMKYIDNFEKEDFRCLEGYCSYSSGCKYSLVYAHLGRWILLNFHKHFTFTNI